jgi:hypothetical protein
MSLQIQTKPAARTLNPAATAVIKGVFASAAQPLEPKCVLTDFGRTVAIVGDLLGSLADQYFKAGKKYASMLATLGRVFWGIVELSVPESTGFYLMRHWLKLATTLAVSMILLGIVFGGTGLAPFGWKLLAVIVGVAILRQILHGYMLTAKWPWKLIAGIAGLAMACVLIWVVAAYGDKLGKDLIWLHQLPQHLVDKWNSYRCKCK